MPYEQRKTTTRAQIVNLMIELIIEEGLSKVTHNRLAKELDLAKANVLYYFPSKEHMLAVLVKELCWFEQKMMEDEISSGKSDLLSYCLELTAMAAICEEDAAAKEFYVSAYTFPMTLQLIRDNDVKKTRDVFSEFCPEWSEERWREAENIVSGIEYGTITTTEENTPLALQIEATLNTVMKIYNVPEELRRQKIAKVLDTDYRALGRRILKEFKDYIKMTSQDALDEARRTHKPSRWDRRRPV